MRQSDRHGTRPRGLHPKAWILLLTLCLALPCTSSASIPQDEPYRSAHLQALQLQGAMKYGQARRKFKRLIKKMEKELGEGHPELVWPVQGLAQIELVQGDYHAARTYWERVVAIWERVRPKSKEMAQALQQVGYLNYLRGDYRQGEQAFQRGLDITKELSGPKSPDYANYLDLVGAYEQMRNAYGRAEALYREASEIRLALPDVPGLKWMKLTGLYRIGYLHMMRGQTADAEKVFNQILEFYRKENTPSSLTQQATTLESIARLYDETDKKKADAYWDAALELHQKQLANYEKQYGKDNVSVIGVRTVLASHYGQRKQYQKQYDLMKEVVAFYKKTYPNMPHTHSGFGIQLGMVLQKLKRYKEAEVQFKAAIEAEKKWRKGSESSSMLYAELLHEMGDYRKAEIYFQKTLKARAMSWGKQHYQTAWVWDRMGTMQRARKAYKAALKSYRTAYDLVEPQLQLVLSSGTEQDKLKFISDHRHHINTAISFHLQDMPASPDAADLALTTILRRKGRVLDALSDSFNALRRRIKDKDKPLLDQLTAARSRLSSMVLKGPGDTPPEEYAREVQELEGTIRTLENKLGTRYAQFKAQTTPIVSSAVKAAVPKDAALVEFIVYSPNDPRKTWDQQADVAHYAAYVLRNDAPPVAVDLGPVKPIDALVGRFREALADPDNDDVIPLARSLDKLTMARVRPLLKEAGRLFVAPDGALNLVPFGALVDENESFLVQRYAISYLSSGRDLIRLSVEAKRRGAPVVIANPDFQGAAAGGVAPTDNASTVRGRRSASLRAMKWTDLPGTAAEAKALANLLGNVKLLTRDQATEDALKAVDAPALLHIATHGFFLESENKEENPLLRSGLILTGANLLTSGNEDGVLTALEASGLNLWGTQLVVLSACETGLGRIRSGEGVYGLRRALVIAGAESQVMSLWQVDDEATRQLMVGFYKRLRQGDGRAQALRASQLELLNDPELEHPFFWASFIGSGQWAPMRVK